MRRGSPRSQKRILDRDTWGRNLITLIILYASWWHTTTYCLLASLSAVPHNAGYSFPLTSFELRITGTGSLLLQMNVTEPLCIQSSVPQVMWGTWEMGQNEIWGSAWRACGRRSGERDGQGPAPVLVCCVVMSAATIIHSRAPIAHKLSPSQWCSESGFRWAIFQNSHLIAIRYM